MEEYRELFSPMKIGGTEIKNRIVMTPMGIDVSNEDGTVSDRTIAYYTERAKGNAGLIITEHCRVNESDGACATGQLSLSGDRHIAGMRKLADAVHRDGAKFFVQLHHPGRQSVPVFPTFWPALETVSKIYPGIYGKFYAAAAKSADIDYTDPASKEQIEKMLKNMRPVKAPSIIPGEEDDGPLAAIKTAAFTTREIHALEKQFIRAAERAKKAGADGIDASVAGTNTTFLVTETTSYEPGWRAPYVRQIKEAVSIPVIAVGVIRTPGQAEQLLKDSVQDFIGLGRPMLADPMWAKKAALTSMSSGENSHRRRFVL